MKKSTIKQVDAFTRQVFTGNPAGVVVKAGGLTEKQKKRIASEMNLSETAFILPAENPEADLRIRWFTPTHEVKLCGHATIASFHSLAENKMYGMTGPGEYHFKVETLSGVLPVKVKIGKDLQSQISFGLPVPRFFAVSIDETVIAGILGMPPDGFDRNYKILQDDFQIVIPVKNREILHKMNPDFNKMIQLAKELDCDAFTPLTTETSDPESAYQSRCFVPSLGVNEDPVTGSSQGPLGVYAVLNGIVPDEAKIRLTGEQGDAMERPGRVEVSMEKNGNEIKNLFITGVAVTVFTTEILVP